MNDQARARRRDQSAEGSSGARVAGIGRTTRDLPARPSSEMPAAAPAEQVAALDVQLKPLRDATAASLAELGSWGTVQRRASGDDDGATAAGTRAIASAGVAGPGDALPHLDRIQASFGRHDVSAARAHIGGAGGAAAQAIGAEAYTAGDQVAFRSPPDLFLAAHEAAHVVQQRGGVQLKGGVGEDGDLYEQHADAVAGLVVQGQSAEALLDRHAGGGAASSVEEEGSEDDDEQVVQLKGKGKKKAKKKVGKVRLRLGGASYAIADGMLMRGAQAVGMVAGVDALGDGPPTSLTFVPIPGVSGPAAGDLLAGAPEGSTISIGSEVWVRVGGAWDSLKGHKAKGDGSFGGFSKYGGGTVKAKLTELAEKGQLAITGREIALLDAVAQVETGGQIGCVQTYDDQIVSIGFKQVVLGHGSLEEMMVKAPAGFAKHGLTIDGSKRYKKKSGWSKAPPQIAGCEDVEQLRSPEWALKFYHASMEPDVVAAMCAYALGEAKVVDKAVDQHGGGVDYFDDLTAQAWLLETYNNRRAYMAKAVARATAGGARSAGSRDAFLDILAEAIIQTYIHEEPLLFYNRAKKGKQLDATADAALLAHMKATYEPIGRRKGTNITTKISRTIAVPKVNAGGGVAGKLSATEAPATTVTAAPKPTTAPTPVALPLAASTAATAADHDDGADADADAAFGSLFGGETRADAAPAPAPAASADDTELMPLEEAPTPSATAHAGDGDDASHGVPAQAVEPAPAAPPKSSEPAAPPHEVATAAAAPADPATPMAPERRQRLLRGQYDGLVKLYVAGKLAQGQAIQKMIAYDRKLNGGIPSVDGTVLMAKLFAELITIDAGRLLAQQAKARPPAVTPTAATPTAAATAAVSPVASLGAADLHDESLERMVASLESPDADAIAGALAGLRAKSKELQKSADRNEEQGAGRDDLVAGIGALRGKVAAFTGAGLDPKTVRSFKAAVYRAIQDIAPFYFQDRNIDILELPPAEKTRTCNITSLSMALESMGRSAANYTGDHDIIAAIASVYGHKIAGDDKSRGAVDARGGRGTTWAAVSQLRLPDFMELAAIAYVLKGAPTPENIKAAGVTAWDAILSHSTLVGLAHKFGVSATSKSFSATNIKYDKRAGTKNDAQVLREHGDHNRNASNSPVEKYLNAKISGNHAAAEKLRPAYEQAISGQGIEDRLSLDAYRQHVEDVIGAELDAGSAVVIGLANHFAKLQAIHHDHLIVDDPARSSRSATKLGYEEARAMGYFWTRIVLS